MGPAARFQTSIELVNSVLLQDRPADGVVSAFLRARRFMGAKDRRAVTERLWNVLRHRLRLSWHLEQLAVRQPPDGRALVFAHAVLCEELGPKAIAELCSGEKFAPGPLTAAERDLLSALARRAIKDPAMPRGTALECPSWVLPMLETALAQRIEEGADLDVAAEIAALTMGSGPLDLRANLLKGSVGNAAAVLAADGIVTTPTPWSPWGLRAEGRPHLAETTAFREGLVEVQDAASQLVALLCAVQPGQAVLDFCAGAGGKTLALAAQMANRGSIVATDTEGGRLDRAKVRLGRAGVHNVTRRGLSDPATTKWLKRSGGRFDRVLVDAPCTGIGTWRRNPDARHRLARTDILELQAVQASLLERVAGLVKPEGGRLIYATCSVLREENEAVLEPFLEAHPEYALVSPAQVWEQLEVEDPNLTLGPCPVGPSDSVMRLTPARHGTDGFCVAILQRQ